MVSATLGDRQALWKLNRMEDWHLRSLMAPRFKGNGSRRKHVCMQAGILFFHLYLDSLSTGAHGMLAGPTEPQFLLY